ncbi:hypothetical protein [Scatolibacter rhodanostii]|uniref:hypothetical protein n=1 Tax=Scatolibacter rhodanostii TaxID=2014781 RepID=UPI000C07B655|nr:hypothetical protein [Scatolibacter rhodanostii]
MMKNKLILCMLVLWSGFFLSDLPVKAASSVNQSVDNIASEFIAQNVPTDTQQIEDKLIINASRDLDSIADSVDAKAYTFTSQNEAYTVIDFYTLDALKFSWNDTFAMTIDDYLWPLQVKEAKLYVKNGEEDWQFVRDLDTFIQLDGAELYSSQLDVRKKYVRVLISLVSDLNPESEAEIPTYYVHYNQAVYNQFNVIPVIIVLVAVIIIIRIIKINKAKKRRD